MGFGQTGIRPDEFRPNEAGPKVKGVVKLELKIQNFLLNLAFLRSPNIQFWH
jgi:hypothetical protein